MFCQTCGNELNDKAVICPKCGCVVNREDYDAAFRNAAASNPGNNGGQQYSAPVNNVKNPGSDSYNYKPEEDVPNAGYSVLSFLIPIFGIIIYATEHKKKPNASKRYLMWSLISIGICVLFTVIFIGVVTFMVLDEPEIVEEFFDEWKDLYR